MVVGQVHAGVEQEHSPFDGVPPMQGEQAIGAGHGVQLEVDVLIQSGHEFIKGQSEMCHNDWARSQT